jgi:hypothetical protein
MAIDPSAALLSEGAEGAPFKPAVGLSGQRVSICHYFLNRQVPAMCSRLQRARRKGQTPRHWSQASSTISSRMMGAYI